MHPADAEKAGVKGQAVVLFDTGTNRLALRSPAADEDGVAVLQRRDKSFAKLGGIAFGVLHAMKSAGWVADGKSIFSGRKKLIHRADGLAIILLEDEPGQED